MKLSFELGVPVLKPPLGARPLAWALYWGAVLLWRICLEGTRRLRWAAGPRTARPAHGHGTKSHHGATCHAAATSAPARPLLAYHTPTGGAGATYELV